MQSAPPSGRAGGFGNRSRRVARRAERDTFGSVIMPAAWMCGAIGAAVLLGVWLMTFSTGGAIHEATGVGLGLVALPVVLFLYRVFRGHFCTALDEP